MEPRARAGKNVGKMNFGFGELRQLLYGSGDTREPLPETMRLLDEIATDFIQGLSFEAARVAHYTGRQKIKYEDFEFALRRNPLFLGKVREMFEMSKEVKDARKMPGIGEGNMGKADINELAKLGVDGDKKEEGSGGGGGGTEGRDGRDGRDGRSSATGVSQKRKYNKSSSEEKKKKKKAKLEAAAAAAAAAAALAATTAPLATEGGAEDGEQDQQQHDGTQDDYDDDGLFGDEGAGVSGSAADGQRGAAEDDDLAGLDDALD